MADPQKRALVEALLSERGHQLLYQQNGWFRSRIDTLTSLLEDIVGGLAVEAMRQEGERLRFLEQKMREGIIPRSTIEGFED